MSLLLKAKSVAENKPPKQVTLHTEILCRQGILLIEDTFKILSEQDSGEPSW